jgi:hypothetical protein
VFHCTIWKNLIETYRTRIEENEMYIINNFNVQEATTYRPVNNELRIIFVFSTSVKEVKQSLIKYPKHYFEFATRNPLIERENKIVQSSGKDM